MELGLSTYLFAEQRLSSFLLDRVLSAQIRTLEIYAAREHFDFYDANYVRDIGQWFLDHNVKLFSLHAPVSKGGARGNRDFPVSPAYLERRQRIDSMDEIKRAIDIAERLPFRYLILHLGLDDEEYDLRKFDAAFTSIEHLRMFAKERGAQVLIENTRGGLGTPQRLSQFLEYTHLDAGACFDAGHAHLTGGIQPAFETLESRIAAVHLHDNRGDSDDHLLPFAGTIEWDAALKTLGALDAKVPFLLEPRAAGAETASMAKIREVAEKLSRVTEP
jgi:sugar phosphate isomerase/epimerase